MSYEIVKELPISVYDPFRKSRKSPRAIFHLSQLRINLLLVVGFIIITILYFWMEIRHDRNESCTLNTEFKLLYSYLPDILMWLIYIQRTLKVYTPLISWNQKQNQDKTFVSPSTWNNQGMGLCSESTNHIQSWPSCYQWHDSD